MAVIDQESNFISEKKSDFTQTMNRLPYDLTEKRVSPWGGLRQTKRRLFFEGLFEKVSNLSPPFQISNVLVMR